MARFPRIKAVQELADHLNVREDRLRTWLRREYWDRIPEPGDEWALTPDMNYRMYDRSQRPWRGLLGDALMMSARMIGCTLGTIFGVFDLAGEITSSHMPQPERHARQRVRLSQKKYRMRGYGGSPEKYTSLHPRQAAQGKRIVYIPGVGYRHVGAKMKAGR